MQLLMFGYDDIFAINYTTPTKEGNFLAEKSFETDVISLFLYDRNQSELYKKYKDPDLQCKLLSFDLSSDRIIAATFLQSKRSQSRSPSASRSIRRTEYMINLCFT